MTTFLNLIVLRARDPEGLARFYQALGLRFQEEKHGAGPRHYSCATGPVILEIYPLDHDAPTTTGLRLGFQVNALDDAVAIAMAEKALLLHGPEPSPWGRRATIQDPEGHVVDLSEAV